MIVDGGDVGGGGGCGEIVGGGRAGCVVVVGEEVATD